MIHKIIATILAFSLVSPLTFAQEMPGKAAPVISDSSEEFFVLNSASDAPSDFETLSEIDIVPETDQVVITFSTHYATYAVIEYGLTREYKYSMTTEAQKMHTETIGELTACTTYYYRVSVDEESYEGTFDTRCPLIVQKGTSKPVIKKTIQSVPKKTKIQPLIINDEQKMVLNAAPKNERESEQLLIQKDSNLKEKSGNEIIVSDNTTVDTESIQYGASRLLPGPIAFGNDTRIEKVETQSMVPVVLVFFVLFFSIAVMLIACKKKKKWYQI